MKYSILIIAIILFSFTSCETEKKTENKQPFQSYELAGASGRDTINLIDGSGLKQGIWITRGSKDTLFYLNDSAFERVVMTPQLMDSITRTNH